VRLIAAISFSLSSRLNSIPFLHEKTPACDQGGIEAHQGISYSVAFWMRTYGNRSWADEERN
jgi:hypothetical protein